MEYRYPGNGHFADGDFCGTHGISGAKSLFYGLDGIWNIMERGNTGTQHLRRNVL
jgi:hypothetical protein